jgi:hypothetical protein
MSYTWPAADAWLLLSLRHSSGVSLDKDVEFSVLELLNTADFLYRLFMNEEEMSGAISRLSALGFLRVADDRLALTPSGRELLRNTKGGSWMEELHRIQPVLASLPRPEDAAGDVLPAGAYEHAAGLYLKKLEGTTSRSSKLKRLDSSKGV